jgi:A/G-specific adenine glycosylase
MSEALSELSQRVVRWQRSHGRHDLPWQRTRDPYHVWLSEVMLQQTQVVTVMAYFERFLQRFAQVQDLAQAPLDEVLALWSGLGYYSRARNLHACAQQVVSRFGGQFPFTEAELQTLPGIGPSTAAAIASICFSQRAAILDGNVKRVLSRALGFEGDLASSQQEKLLWQQAREVLPAAQDMPTYTQGVMDLGATVCISRQPRCGVCPLSSMCVAHAQNRAEAYPVKTRKLKRTSQSLWLLCASNASGQVWLRQRPVPGVWAGLYCFELFDDPEALTSHVLASSQGAAPVLAHQAPFKHVLTHKDLHLHAVRCVMEAPLSHAGRWFALEEALQLGLPAPIKTMLAQW